MKVLYLKLLFFVGIAAVTCFLCFKFPNAATDPESGMVDRLPLPSQLQNYQGVERKVSELEKEWLPPDTRINKRVYYPKDALSAEEAYARSVSLTLILSGNDQRSLHRPEVCLDAQGWTVTQSVVVPLEIGGKRLEVRDLHLERFDQQKDKSLRKTNAHYVYWWVGKGRTTHSSLQRKLHTALDNMFLNRNSRWGYPSVMVFSQGEDGQEKAQKRAYDFIENYGSLFMKEYFDQDLYDSFKGNLSFAVQ